MAGPSNMRVNPFTGTGGATNYVELTEKHIIPAVSPYVIRLNEVPEKQDPSNMKMVYVDSATGAATENALTEVAATPGQGEFRPDYSTNALDDKTWNTGLIEFSASDAGKIVQVTYTGTGTLAGVNSNHWPSWYTDRGDGSDGDFVPTENTTISGVKNYKSVFIKSGITVTVDKYTFIKCLGCFFNQGTVTGNGKGVDGSETVDSNGGTSGYRCYSKKGDNGTGVGNAGAGGSDGLPGGLGSVINEAKLTREQFYDVLLKVFHGIGIGAGGASGEGYDGGGGNRRYGGKGGNGGAAIVIVSNSINNKGTIEVNGTNGAAGWGDGSVGGSGGGGAGGSIVGIANSIIDKGITSVKGGESEGTKKGGTGEDGIVIWKELGV